MNHRDKNASNEDREPGPASRKGPGPELMGADTLIGKDVYNHVGDDLGVIKEIMLDMRSGRAIYAVLSFKSFLGLGEKLFAVPWRALTLDTEQKRFTLDVDRNRLKDAPGFDKGHWPDMADQHWQLEISRFYGSTGWE
ncbi:PRC-barrel domain protein [compost metagenome]